MVIYRIVRVGYYTGSATVTDDYTQTRFEVQGLRHGLRYVHARVYGSGTSSAPIASLST